MRKLLFCIFLIFISCKERKELAQIRFKAYSIELPDYFKRVRLDDAFTETYYLTNGDTLNFVNDAFQDKDLVYSKKNDSTYVIKILFGAPEGAEYGGRIYTNRKGVFYLSSDKRGKTKPYRGLTTHIIIFEVSTRIKDPRFKNYF